MTVANASHAVCEVGLMYLVPCLFIGQRARQRWMPRDGWVPVLGPKHRDAEHLNFDHEHYHVDWRFIATAVVASMTTRNPGVPHGKVITNDGDWDIQGAPVLKQRKCRQAMPEHPPITSVNLASVSRDVSNWRALERAHACTRLKPGGICPHRGIDLTPFAREDGTAVCPGHGLRWNLKTGELVPHHTAEAA